MHLVIIDSGLGGLSVCAILMNLLKESDYSDSNCPTVNLKITYINAAPSDKYGFNSMSGQNEQISTFKKILLNIEKLYSPDLIFVACGTLSGLLDEIHPYKYLTSKLEGIIPIGTKLILESLINNSKTITIIFGTPITIEKKYFQKQLIKNGISNNRIISQACPELATNISSDSEGIKVSKMIQNFVKNTLKKIPNMETSLIGFLGCTHYGYRESIFSNSFNIQGYNNIKIINPNFSTASYLRDIIFLKKKHLVNKRNNISLEFVSPYSIPKKELITLTKLLDPVSTDTSLALNNANICPKLLED